MTNGFSKYDKRALHELDISADAPMEPPEPPIELPAEFWRERAAHFRARMMEEREAANTLVSDLIREQDSRFLDKKRYKAIIWRWQFAAFCFAAVVVYFAVSQ